MPAKKNKSANKSLPKTSLIKENAKHKGKRQPTKPGKEKDNKKKKFLQSVLDFTILNQAGEALQEDVSEDSFNPPLHSTAVYTEDDDLSEKTKASLEKTPNQTSSGRKVSQEKGERGNHAQKNKSAVSERQSLTPQRVPRKKPKTPQKKATLVKDLDDSEKGASSQPEEEKTGIAQPTSPSEQDTHTTPHRKTTSENKRKETPNTKKLNKSKHKEHIELTVWSPEDAPGTARDVNELDVILFESGQLVEHYSESIDGVCRKAVDTFFLSYKDQLTTSIKNVRMLKDLKRKNAKAQAEMGRKQKRLIEVNDEIIKKQPRLNQLQKDITELEERQKSIKNAKSFLDNLEQLQEDYKKRRTKNPKAKETFGLSSLPARILQAQSTMTAEKHFHNMNTQLQNMQKGK